jgi:hypothetical protein
MPKIGGKRPGAGRKPGSANRRTREIADAASFSGVTPLEWMLSVVRDENADVKRRDGDRLGKALQLQFADIFDPNQLLRSCRRTTSDD